MLLTAPSLDKDKLKNVFMNTRHLNDLCKSLNIPEGKQNVDDAVEHFAQSTEPRKVRKMIWELDSLGSTAFAESVMEYAEPPAGMHCYVVLQTSHLSTYATLSHNKLPAYFKSVSYMYANGQSLTFKWFLGSAKRYS